MSGRALRRLPVLALASAWTHCIGAVDNMATPRTVSTGKECSRTVLLAKKCMPELFGGFSDQELA